MHVLLLGANSDVAFALAHVFSKNDNAILTLASRDMTSLEKKTADLNVRFGVDATAVYFDMLDISSHAPFYRALKTPPDLVILAAGFFGDEIQARHDTLLAATILNSNFNGAISILDIIANDFEARKEGVIVGISSVGGLRGRASNAHYGAAKAGLSSYLSSLRQRLSSAGVPVITVLPGFIKTKMIAGVKTPALITAAPEKVAADIYKAIKKKRNVIYSGWMWRWIMLIVRYIPEAIYKKLSF
jgi:decaprenylphospho-beta-D-erythro-pentofuranosid-2-ulose 2-reductase